MPKKLTISDALVLYGFDAEDLIGRSGKGITCTVNGEVRRFRGELGKAAEIWLNGKPASLDTALSFGDNITVIPAQNGRNASVKASELVPDHSNSSVILNGNPVDTSAVILVNGVQASGETDIKDGDVVQFSRIRTLGELLEAAGFMGVDCDIAVNGSKNHDYDYLLMNGDIITCVERKSDEYQDITSSSTVPGIEAVEDTDLLPSTDEWFDVTVNGRTVSLKKKPDQAYVRRYFQLHRI